jgi:hypothetical protein
MLQSLTFTKKKSNLGLLGVREAATTVFVA